MRPSYVVTAAVQQVTIPHDTMIREIHREGVKYFMAMLDGNSKRTYGLNDQRSRWKLVEGLLT